MTLVAIAGHFRWKSLWFLTVPGLLVTHVIAIVLSLRGQGIAAGFREYCLECSSLKSAFQRALNVQEDQDDSAMRFYRGALALMLILSVVGFGLLLVNILVPESLPGCMDPLISTTFASSLDADPVYQWLFVLLSAAEMLALGLALEYLRRRSSETRGIRVYRVLEYLCRTPALKAAHRAIQQWKTGLCYNASGQHQHGALEPLAKAMALPSVTTGRRLLYWAFHLPLLVLASAPAFGFVRL